MSEVVVLNIPDFIKVVVGRVMADALKVPFITPIIIKPFIFVIAALKTTLFNPDIGLERVMVGVVNTCKSSLNYFIITFASAPKLVMTKSLP